MPVGRRCGYGQELAMAAGISHNVALEQRQVSVRGGGGVIDVNVGR